MQFRNCVEKAWVDLPVSEGLKHHYKNLISNIIKATTLIPSIVLSDDESYFSVSATELRPQLVLSNLVAM